MQLINLGPIRLLIKTHEDRSCKEKVRYGHKETALRAVAAMKKKHGSELEPYECQYCEGWHIGHS